MAGTIIWETDLSKAQERAHKEGKAIFLDFFNPQ